MGEGTIIIVSNQQHGSTNTKAWALLMSCGDKAGGDSRCADTDVFPLQDVAWKQMIHVSPPLKCGAAPQWGSRRR